MSTTRYEGSISIEIELTYNGVNKSSFTQYGNLDILIVHIYFGALYLKQLLNAYEKCLTLIKSEFKLTTMRKLIFFHLLVIIYNNIFMSQERIVNTYLCLK